MERHIFAIRFGGEMQSPVVNDLWKDFFTKGLRWREDRVR
jgi:hypothetical protein